MYYDGKKQVDENEFREVIQEFEQLVIENFKEKAKRHGKAAERHAVKMAKREIRNEREEFARAMRDWRRDRVRYSARW